MHQYQGEFRNQRQEQYIENSIYSNDLFDSHPPEFQSEPQRNIGKIFELNQHNQEVLNYQDSHQEEEIKEEFKVQNDPNEADNLNQSFGDPLAINDNQQHDLDPLNIIDPIELIHYIPVAGPYTDSLSFD